MQRRCEARKKEDESLHLCLPGKSEPPPLPALQQTRYFLVGDGIGLILELRDLNKYLRKYKFRMLTHVSLLPLVCQGTLNCLKDAYFHIPHLSSTQEVSKVCFLGCLLKAQSASFQSVPEVAIAPLRQQGIHRTTYLDDWLLLARLKQESVTQTDIILKHLVNLGFIINAKTSMLSPV